MNFIKIEIENNESIMINLDNIKYIENNANEDRTICYFIDGNELVFENSVYEDMKKMMNFKEVSEQ